jgi:hypothetical protein
MSSWIHFTGSFGIGGMISSEKEWHSIGNNIKSIIFPLPRGSEGAAKHKIKLNNIHNIHFADVLVSGDLRDIDSLDCLEEWLLGVEKRLEERGWDILIGCFIAHTSYTDPEVYYYDDMDEKIASRWKRINVLEGEYLT